MRIAIVEDEELMADTIKGLVDRYAKEKNVSIDVTHFSNPLQILSNSSHFDAVFMDIDMPLMNGMDAAKEIRKQNSEVIIVFITNLQQYAADGYLVEALDYLLKPIQTIRFHSVMDKIFNRLAKKAKSEISVVSKGVIHCLDAQDITYIDIQNHQITYHLVDGNDIVVWGILKKIEKDILKNKAFFKCSYCAIVNLQYVRGMEENYVMIGKDTITVSRQKKKELMKALLDYMNE